MRLCDIDPYVRFAASVFNGVMRTAVKVTDCRVFYVEEGSLNIYIDGACRHMEKNSLFYCCGGSTYRVQTESDVRLICINFDLTRYYETETRPFSVCAKQEQWAKMRVHFDPVEDSSFLNGHLLMENASWLLESIRELVREQEGKTALSSLLCGSLLKAILLRLHQTRRQEMPRKLILVQEYIRSNYTENLTNKQLGALAGYHEYYLNRMFRVYTGMNLHEYLIKVRMEQASYLILNTRLPLGDISEAVGIRSYPHFSACFKSCYGCSPAQYRSRHYPT